MTHRFLALEDFYLHHQEKAVDFLGWRLASAAWSLKDAGETLSDDQIEICRRLQKAIKEKVGSRPAEWLIEVEESHSVIDFGRWIDHCIENTKLPESEQTGRSEIDFNFETQLVCGAQLEEMQKGSWVKARLEKMFECDSFEPMDPLVCRFEHPLPDLLAKLDKDLELGVQGGMRHPYQCSAAVGALTLRLLEHEGMPEERIVLARRSRLSNINAAVGLLHEEAKARQKALVASIKEYQGYLKQMPEGWPSSEVYAKCMEWSGKRFAGDNGLVGSDLFDGIWVRDSMPQDVHRAVGTLSHDPGSFAQMAQTKTEVPAEAEGQTASGQILTQLEQRRDALKRKGMGASSPKKGIV